MVPDTYYNKYICIHIQFSLQPIHQAAIHGNVELLVMLIEQFGVDPQEKADVSYEKLLILSDESNTWDYTCSQRGLQPIHCAAASGEVEIIQLLVEKYGVSSAAQITV